MGPPSLDGGELVLALWSGPRLRRRLQWGPRLSTGGSRCERPTPGYTVLCSFNGAPSLDGGESKPLRMQWPVGLALQWGPRLSTGGSRRVNPAVGGGRIGFNGAPVSRRGGAPNTLVFAKSLPRFNGAPVSRRGGEYSLLLGAQRLAKSKACGIGRGCEQAPRGMRHWAART